MPAHRDQLKRAVHVIMNDVVEQCFQCMVNHPHLSEQLNQIVRDASDEIQYQVLKIDAHSYPDGSSALEEHYRGITKDLQRKSLMLLSKVQKMQQNERA